MWITHKFNDGAVIGSRHIWYQGRQFTIHTSVVGRFPMGHVHQWVAVRQSAGQRFPRAFPRHGR